MRSPPHESCLERNRPGGQTPSSERVRLGIDTNFLCGPGSDVEVLDEEALGEERERRERSELDVEQRHQRHKMRMRVRDDYEFADTTLS